MNSKKSLASSKSLLSIDTKKMINIKCKQDHFAFKKQLSIKKNHSSYTSAYGDADNVKVISKFDTENYKKNIAPASLDHALVKRSLHESTVHYSQNKNMKLPTIQVGSSYSRSFHTKSQETLVKGKEKDGFFIKMPWHENPLTNYQKSYETPNINPSNSLEKGKPHEDSITMIRKPFKAQSNYGETFTKTMQRSATLHIDSTDVIKSKDHLKGINCHLNGQSEYKSRFERNSDKENQPSRKSLGSKKKISLLPEINPVRRYQKEEVEQLPKKSIMMKKTASSPSEEAQSQTHKKMPSNLFW